MHLKYLVIPSTGSRFYCIYSPGAESESGPEGRGKQGGRRESSILPSLGPRPTSLLWSAQLGR